MPSQIQTMNANHELIENLTELLRVYYADEIAQLAQRYPRDQKSLYLDYDDVFQFDRAVAKDLREQPRQLRDYLEEALQLHDLPADIDLGDAHVRPYNLPEEHTLDVAEVSRHENIGTLVDIRGQVQKVSGVRPRLVMGAFECNRCGTITEEPQSGDDLREPHECEGCERNGPYDLNAHRSEWTNHQYARLQQPPERTKGGDGETIDVHLQDDLIQEFQAGDRVVLTGILDVEEPGGEQSRNFDTQVDAVAVVREESDYEDIDIEAHRDEVEAIASGEKGDPYGLLVDSINPEHYGDEVVKLAITLQLFGGWARGAETGNRDRGDSHILLLGDPGCGKSTFLQVVDELAPRSTYTSGKGATKAGLTAGAVSDDFGDTEWGLEAGALVLADGGVACVDEIDKVNDEALSSMHGALESQKVRVTKVVKATLNARTALLAAGNPTGGRFDPYQLRAEQIDLDSPMLSRFDLMFMISDSVDEEEDRSVVRHMMQSRRAGAKRELGQDLSEAERESKDPAIEPETLRAYIALAKEECFPYIPEDSDAEDLLEEEFMALRLANGEEGESEDAPIPVTYRQEQALERLAEASARVRLDDTVRTEDVERAAWLVRESLKQVGIDPETGEMDADIVEAGASKSQRERRRGILNAVDELGGATIDDLDEFLAYIERDQLEHDIKVLKQEEGRLYQMSGELHRA